MTTPLVSPCRLLVALLAAHVLTPSAAHAYIDPVSGSVILQALLAGALGVLLSVKRVGFAVRTFFSRVWKRIHG